MNPVLKTILQGVYDEESILSYLKGTPRIVKKIWLILRSWYISHIKLPMVTLKDQIRNGYFREVVTLKNELLIPESTFLQEVKSSRDLLLPSPADININMMPYIYGGEKFEDYKLPDYLISYFPVIELCRPRSNFPKGKRRIYYLTIQEGWVEANKTQRRPGIHTENPGPVALKYSDKLAPQSEGKGSSTFKWYEHHSGNGLIFQSTEYEGGIFMRSSLSNSCCVWNCKIEPDLESCTEIMWQHGSCEHLREFLPENCKIMMEPDVLYWITDRTPHELHPVKERTYCQFFRVVTGNVSLWFADHYTQNPCGVLPDPSITKIVKGNRFDSDSLEIIEHEDYSC